MSRLAGSDRARCEELAARPGSVFELVHRFLSGPQADRVLAIEAFFRSVREIPLRISEPSVAVAKLSWWLGEIAGLRQRGSQHPVLRALLHTGGADVLAAGGWDAYLRALAESVSQDPPPDTDGFARRLRRIGGHEALVWAGLQDADPGAEQIAWLGVASQILELSQGLSTGERRWLPLNWQAELEGEGAPTAQLAGLAARMAGWALDCQDRAGRDWRARLPNQDGGTEYLTMRVAIERRRLERIKARPERWVRTGHAGSMAAEVLSTWRIARHQSRKSAWAD